MKANSPEPIAQSKAFFLPGDRTGCLLIHGFTAMPEEMRELGEHLANAGRTVLGVRLAGHGTRPDDLARVRWTDWLASVEDGLAILRDVTDRILVIGQGLGGALALLTAARCPVTAVVALSTPDRLYHAPNRVSRRLHPLNRKDASGHQDRSVRRELDYPAYPYYPNRALNEVDALLAKMRKALPKVQAPALLIHAGRDSIPLDSLEQIYRRVGSADKQKIELPGMDPSVPLDPQRAIFYAAIDPFIQRVTGSP